MTTHFGVCLQELLMKYNSTRERRCSSRAILQHLSDGDKLSSRVYLECMSLTIQAPRQHGLTAAICNTYGTVPVMCVTSSALGDLDKTLLDTDSGDGNGYITYVTCPINNPIHSTIPRLCNPPLYNPNTYKPYFDKLSSDDIPVVIFIDMMHKFERGMKRGRVIDAILAAAGNTLPDVLFLG